ncbi:DUF5724 domain-containing protein [Stieleria sp. JC731]|uniref:DUF5724 domain-containing protein n=1 Tax=Pirellulaceae TaxID=2691357 RepID=UPI001E2997CE|nr:DUF5724 domain-containing protein [Stieleria sp. JC731]MCC9599065.1 DUF5724 domain-containing protein [Stieleria sp. JC731]
MALSPEEAQQQVTQWLLPRTSADGVILTFDEQVQAELAKRLELAPDKLRRICFGLFGRDHQGNSFFDWSQINDAEADAHHALEQLSDSEVSQLIAAATGNIAPLIETTWNWMATTCESYHYEKKTIRSSSIGPAVQVRRALWLKAMIEICLTFQDEILTLPMIAAWAPYLQTGYITREQQLGQLIAANLTAGHEQSEETLDVLHQIVQQEHEVGVLGDHVFYALWASDCVEGWEIIERLLLATDTSEGLRQVILLAAFDAHPDALGRLFGLLHEQGMTRHGSVVQAMDDWLGWHWSGESTDEIIDAQETLAHFVSEPGQAESFLADPFLDAENASDVYLALWAVGVRSVEDALAAAGNLIEHSVIEVRYATVCYLAWLEFTPALPLLGKAVSDEDERVALKSLRGIDDFEALTVDEISSHLVLADVESLFDRLPVKTLRFAPIVWPWTETKARRIDLTEALFLALGNRSATLLLPHRKDLSPEGREKLANHLADSDDWDAETRAALVEMVGDLSLDVREIAVKALREHGLQRDELVLICEFLKRKSADLRNEIIKLLLLQDDDTAMEMANLLCSSRNKQQRLAGLELLRCLAKENRDRSACVDAASGYSQQHKKLSKEEQLQINAILKSYKPKLSTANGFGLFSPSRRTQVVTPKKNRRQAVSAAARKLLSALDELVDENRAALVTFRHGSQDMTQALAVAGEAFVDLCDGRTIEQVRSALPLADLWDDWFAKRPKALTDRDNLEVMRALFLMQSDDDYDRSEILPFIEETESRKALLKCIGQDGETPPLRYPEHVQGVLEYWLMPVTESDVLDYLLDVTENLAASIPQEDYPGFIPTAKREDVNRRVADPYQRYRTNEWLWLCKIFLESKAVDPNVQPTKQQWERIWKVLRWCDEPTPGARRLHCHAVVIAKAYLAGVATFDDVVDQLIGPRFDDSAAEDFELLSTFTDRRVDPSLEEFLQRSEIQDLLNKIRETLLEIELQRGESETTATGAITAIKSFFGAQTLLQILRSVGDAPLRRDRSTRSSGHKRAVVLTKLAIKTYPAVSDTPENFARLFSEEIKSGVLTDERLIELSTLAPQWADHVDATVGSV